MTPTSIIGYLVLFAATAVAFLVVSLLLGRLLRIQAPSAHKAEPYECGEPAVGSSFVQFNLRFYVVALVFLIFDVEVAFFFPWATVYGKATQLMDAEFVTTAEESGTPSPAVANKLAELGVPREAMSPAATAAQIRADARALALTAIVDLAVFFAVLMVGFAYVWARGDIDWILAMGKPEEQAESLAAGTRPGDVLTSVGPYSSSS